MSCRENLNVEFIEKRVLAGEGGEREGRDTEIRERRREGGRERRGRRREAETCLTQLARKRELRVGLVS